jgi:glycosyltransferase involved in cell wall biosynthesis
MAMEKPIVLGVEGESAELVMSSGGGVCVEPENGKALADQVLKLSQDPARCKELGTSGRRSVLAHFDRQVLARKLTDVMQQVVSKG